MNISVDDIMMEMAKFIEEFDQIYVSYEHKYIFELMKISVKAKHLIREAIEEEKKLTMVETKEK